MAKQADAGGLNPPAFGHAGSTPVGATKEKTMSGEFWENSDGVHFLIAGSEHALCGDAFDIGSEEGMESMVKTDKRVVTCERCKAVLQACEGVEYG